MSTKKSTIFTILDEIISAHHRDGLGKGQTLAVRSDWSASLFGRYGPFIGAKVSRRKVTFKGESWVEAAYLARSYLEVLVDYQPEILSFPVESQFSLFNAASQWPKASFIAFAKYMTAFPLARHMQLQDPQNTLPTCPTGFTGNPLVFTGAIKRFLKNRIISHSASGSRPAVQLLWSILQGVKRACAPISSEFIHETMLKHKRALSKPDNSQWEDVVEYDSLCLQACEGFSFSMDESIGLEPSQSASYEATRSSGGARDYIRNELLDIITRSASRGGYDSWEMVKRIVAEPDELIKMVEVRPGVIREMRGMPQPSRLEIRDRALQEIGCKSSTLGASAVQLLDSEGEGESWHPVLQEDWGLIDTFVRKPLNIMVSVVREPLKGRTISKGQSWSYYYSRPLQKKMWRFLQTFPQFALTGRPMDSSDLRGILLREEKLGLETSDFSWVSGDYSAATDNLKGNFTKLVFEQLMFQSDILWADMEIFRAVIYEQMINYPKEQTKLGGLEPFLQKSGQLMGSTLSFPILCLVNLMAYAKTFEDIYPGKEYNLRDLPVLINGDDILFRCNASFYQRWQYRVKQVGFELSLGKNYIHPTLLTVNSELYRYRPSQRDFQKINFFNPGLLTGQSKVTGREQGNRAKPWNDNLTEVLEGSVTPERAVRRFVHYNRKAIEDASLGGTYNIFIPIDRGGFGVKAPQSYRPKVTSFQRRFAQATEKFVRESLAVGEVPKRALGLVVDRVDDGSILIEHKPESLEIYPPVGPLEHNVSLYGEKFSYATPMLRSGVVLEPSQKFRVPLDTDPRLKMVRDRTVDRMGNKKIFSSLGRLVERRTPLNPE